MRSPFLAFSLLLLCLLASEVKEEVEESMQGKLLKACQTGDLDTVTLLLETQKLDASEALVIAAETGNLKLVSVLIRSPLKMRKLHKALIRACKNGHTEVVRRLTADQRCNPAHDNNAAIFVTCSQGHLEAFEVLLKKDKVVRAIIDNSLLAVACQQGSVEMVSLLGPYIKFHQVAQSSKDLPDPSTHRRTSPRLSLSPGHDTPFSVLMKLCLLSVQKGHSHMIAYLFSPESPLNTHCTMEDRLAVVDKLLEKLSIALKQNPTEFIFTLISMLVSIIFDEPGSLNEKLFCCIEHKLMGVKAVLDAFVVFQNTAMIGMEDGDFALPTELRQLIAYFALLN